MVRYSLVTRDLFETTTCFDTGVRCNEKAVCNLHFSLEIWQMHNENTPLMLFPSSIILMEAVNTASTAVGSFRSRRGPVITSVDPVPAEQVGSSGLGGLDNLANSGQEALSSKIKQNLFLSLSQTILLCE